MGYRASYKYETIRQHDTPMTAARLVPSGCIIQHDYTRKKRSRTNKLCRRHGKQWYGNDSHQEKGKEYNMVKTCIIYIYIS